MKLLIKGGTGSGKTYKAFEIAKQLGTYMYLAPTKMLAYESFIAYGGDNSRINTSSVKFGDKNAQNYFGCYAAVGKYIKQTKLTSVEKSINRKAKKIEKIEKKIEKIQSEMIYLDCLETKCNLKMLYLYDKANKLEKLTSNVKDVKQKEIIVGVHYDTIIIDEAHWASQNDNHAFWIKKVVNEFDGNIILVTAEDINAPTGFETLELEGFHVEGTVEYGYSSWINNIQNSRASLAICSSLKDAEYLSEALEEKHIKHHFVYRGVSEEELIKFFFDFKEKGGVLVATNMAQQGINLPCDNLLLELNDYDTTVSISQKIGRVGRRGYTKKGDKNRIFVYDGSGDRSVPEDSTIESYKNLYKSSISVDWTQHKYNYDDVPPIEHRDHEAEMLLKLFVENNRIINARKCA